MTSGIVKAITDPEENILTSERSALIPRGRTSRL
jgi:hypothetical protein